MTSSKAPPIRFAFGVHLHQPVGNFDHVFEQHVRDVYLPFLERIAEREFFPIALHISGPLLEWLEKHDTDYLDLLGSLAGDGKIELLLAGFYEPVLASLPKADRVEQIQWMREELARLFGVQATGLWLTERVWEPDLAADLADAGVRYALVDDRHFLVSGFPRERLHAPYWTESGGQRVILFPIDEKLRYLIPFQPPADTASYLRALRADGHRLAVLADDGEKFGGWPGTKEWVYDRGWLAQFLEAMSALIGKGEMRLTRLDDAASEVPSGGLAYLPTASYREMEGWSLPPEGAIRLSRLEQDLGATRFVGPDGSLIRGAHWRNFLVKYPESNRMHKKMLALSDNCRRSGDPEAARRAIGRAQCNDAYWHGVFGGLYLPHLREAIWKQLAVAERVLREGQDLSHEVVDIDCDGHEEIWVHSSRFSAIISPRRGGAIEEYTLFETGTNYCDTLTRRREAYHQLETGAAASKDATHSATGEGGRSPSIHEIEQGIRLHELPPADLDDRAMFVDRVLSGEETFDAYTRAEYEPIISWARVPLEFEVTDSAGKGAIEVKLSAKRGSFEKRLRFAQDGALTVTYTWDGTGFAADGYFAPEISLSKPLELVCAPSTEVWSYPIETVAKSERGLDQTIQGKSHTPRWPVRDGGATVAIVPPQATARLSCP